MATPRGNSYSVASGESVYAGRSPWPSWRTAMAAHTWAVIPFGNSPADVDPEANPLLNPNHPNPAPWHGLLGAPGRYNSWGGLVMSADSGEIWEPIGGGHSDYAGNESLKADLMLEAPVWTLMHPPSGAIGQPAVPSYADGQEATGVYSDGRIRAIHLYTNAVHVPGGNIFLGSPAAPYYNSNLNMPRKSFWIDRNTGVHSVASDYEALGADATGKGEGGACYDPSRHCIWHVKNDTSNKLLKTDLATGVTTSHGTSNSWVGGRSTLVYDPIHDLVVNLTGISNGLAVFNPVTNAWNRATTTAGTPATGLEGLTLYGGGCWVPSLGGIALWNQTSNTTAITLMTPPESNQMAGPWTFSVLPLSGANAVTPPTRHSSNSPNEKRFGYLHALKGFVLKPSYESATYFYALP